MEEQYEGTIRREAARFDHMFDHPLKVSGPEGGASRTDAEVRRRRITLDHFLPDFERTIPVTVLPFGQPHTHVDSPPPLRVLQG